MPLGLGTAEKSSGSVRPPCMLVSQMSFLPPSSLVSTHSDHSERKDEGEAALVVDKEFQFLSGKYFKFSVSLNTKLWSRESQQAL